MVARRIIKKKDARTCSQVTFTNRGCVKGLIAAAVDSIVCKSNLLRPCSGQTFFLSKSTVCSNKVTVESVFGHVFND